MACVCTVSHRHGPILAPAHHVEDPCLRLAHLHVAAHADALHGGDVVLPHQADPVLAEHLLESGEAGLGLGAGKAVLGKPISEFHALGYRFILSGVDAIFLQQTAYAAARSLRDQRAALPAAKES